MGYKMDLNTSHFSATIIVVLSIGCMKNQGLIGNIVVASSSYARKKY